MLTVDSLIERLTDIKRSVGGSSAVKLCVSGQRVSVIDSCVEDGSVSLLASDDIVVPQVVIDVVSGVVQDVSSNVPLTYLILDEDCMSEGDFSPMWREATEDYKRVIVLSHDPNAETEG